MLLRYAETAHSTHYWVSGKLYFAFIDEFSQAVVIPIFSGGRWFSNRDEIMRLVDKGIFELVYDDMARK
jgi:hypothetical protein